MSVVDAHGHVLPGIYGLTGHGETRWLGGGLVRAADGELTRLLPPLARGGEFPPDVILAYMDMVGVDRLTLLQGSVYGGLNEFVREAVLKWPGRFMACGTFDPSSVYADRLYARTVRELGYRNFKFECSQDFGLSGFHPNFSYVDERWSEMWDKADRDGLTVIIDPGPPGTTGFRPAELLEVSSRWESLRLVVAHVGFPPPKSRQPEFLSQWRQIVKVGKRPNVWFDTAGFGTIEGDRYPCPLGQEYLREVVETVGPDRIMWGSDIPYVLNFLTYRQSLDFISECAFLSESDRELIIGVTAGKVFQEMELDPVSSP